MASERVQRQIDRLLDEAEEAFSRGDWELLRERANRALLLDPENGDAEGFVAAAERALGGDVHAQPDRPAPPAPPTLEPSVAHPASFASGRYQVKEFLGEGARKRVYRAHDTVLDRDVALAVIRTEGLDVSSRVRVTREAQAMARLGDHPHVLSIHDLGEEDGRPYMVLPLMPGGDVARLLDSADGHRLISEKAIDLASQICLGLEFAHSKGIVHRDLKPGNVWLSADGDARIGDFGLAVSIDRSRLTQEGMMVGTVSYMPPEQAMGGEVTPRSDLYSLGAMLYEMVCGRPPFSGDDSVAIIGQHINTAPVAPTWHTPDCPRALDALILRLLAKDPSERPESASDVLTALEGIDLEVGVGAQAESAEGNVLDSLAGGVFVGRQREMGELKAALEDALSGRGRMVTLVGEPGIGKTRTAQELSTYARMRGAQVLIGRCYEDTGAPPYWPWVQAIRAYAREKSSERLRSEMGTGAGPIAEIVSDVRERIAGLEPVPRVDDPEQARFRLFDSIATFLRNAGQTQPLVLILDDLHWSDRPSLMLLEFVARDLAGSRVLLIGTYRDMELNRRHPLAVSLGDLMRDRLFQRILLRGLSRDDVARFVEAVAGIAPPRGLVEAVHTQTEGNPLFVTEVVRLLTQEGQLGGDGSGRDKDGSWTVRIPEGVREVIGRRLDRLSQRCNDTLTIASVVGREFSLDEVRPLSEDISDDRLLDVLDEAIAAKVIDELPDSVGRYQFTHALIQETLLAEVSITRRVRLHARIGEALEGLYGDDADAHAAELVHHFGQAEAIAGTEKLVHYSLKAGERALAAYASHDALAYFEQALAGKEGRPMDAETADILFGLGKSQAATLASIRMKEALETLIRAFDYYESVGDIEKAVAVAEHYIEGPPGLLMEAVAFGARALKLVPFDSHEAGRILSRQGFLFAREMADFDSARDALERALTIARREHDIVLETRIVTYSSEIHMYNLEYRQALEEGLKAIELARRSDDRLREAYARHTVAHALCLLGEVEDALSQAGVALELAENLGNQTVLVSVLWVTSLAHYLNGHWQAAREFTDRSLQLSPRGGRILAMRVALEYQVGNWDEANAFFRRHIEMTSDTGLGAASLAYGMQAVVMTLGTTVAELETDLDQARSIAERLLLSSTRLPNSEYAARMALGLIAVKDGDAAAAAEAYTALSSARIHLTAFSAAISNDRILGMLAHTVGQLDDAATHFEEAMEFSRKAGYQPELAWTCYDYAQMLLDPSTGPEPALSSPTGRTAEENRQKAVTLLDESLAISSELVMRPLMERVLARKMDLQGIDISSPDTSIDIVASAVEIERPDLQSHAAPDGTVTVMFTDIEGSTAMTERLGDQGWMALLRRHNDTVRRQIATHEGFEVKSQGDGFMVAFASAGNALRCSTAIQRALAAHEVGDEREVIRVRIGLHTGEAIKEGEDFFGRSVILAARIASQASGGQILVSALLRSLLEGSTEFSFGPPNDVTLKGLAGTHRVFDVMWPNAE